MLKKSLTIMLLITTITACTKSNERNQVNMRKNVGIMTTCELHSSEYGIIGCGVIPLSTKNEVNNVFLRKCFFDFDKIERDDFNCLEENKNNPPDGYILGFYKYFGTKTDLNESEGFELISKAADSSYPEALMWLSVYYGNEGDLNKSFELKERAAKLGYPLAMYDLGFSYSRGIGVNVNEELAIKWLNQSKEYIAASYSELGIIHLRHGNVKDFLAYSDKAIYEKYWYASADLALFFLGDIAYYEEYMDVRKAKNILIYLLIMI